MHRELFYLSVFMAAEVWGGDSPLVQAVVSVDPIPYHDRHLGVLQAQTQLLPNPHSGTPSSTQISELFASVPYVWSWQLDWDSSALLCASCRVCVVEPEM